jgi:hypothetical protein
MNNSIESKRGKVKLEHEGFLYIFHKFNADRDVKFWRCEFHGSKDINCKGRVHTDLQGNFLKYVGEHTCPAGAENIGVKRVVTALKRRAVDTMETPAVLRANILQNVPTPIMAQVPDKAASKKVKLRWKKKEFMIFYRLSSAPEGSSLHLPSHSTLRNSKFHTTTRSTRARRAKKNSFC